MRHKVSLTRLKKGKKVSLNWNGLDFFKGCNWSNRKCGQQRRRLVCCLTVTAVFRMKRGRVLSELNYIMRVSSGFFFKQPKRLADGI